MSRQVWIREGVLTFRLWHSPMNILYLGFSKQNLKRFDWGGHSGMFWFAFFGMWGKAHIASWPWQKNPTLKYKL